MTPEIATTLTILAVAILLFVTEKIRPDIVALLVLLSLVLTRIITPEQALSGFSNPAVIVVACMFVVSAALGRTGVASLIGERVLRFAGKGESRLIAVIMLSSGLISGAGMNNIGVTALMLPVVTDIARRTKQAASRLLLPLLYAALVGGMLLLIGTPTNLLASEALQSAGFPALGMFAFTPAAAVFLIFTVLYMSLLGKYLLPNRQPLRLPSSLERGEQAALEANHIELYGLEERLAYLVIPENSLLIGKNLSQIRIGQALGMNILVVEREGEQPLVPELGLRLRKNDRLLVLGRLDRIKELHKGPTFEIVDDPIHIDEILPADINIAEFEIGPDSPLARKTIAEASMRQKYGVNVLAIHRGESIRRTKFQQMRLEPGDLLLVQGRDEKLEGLRDQPGFRRLTEADVEEYQLEDRLLCIRIPEGSGLAGKSLKEVRLAGVYGLSVLEIQREGQELLMLDPETKLLGKDVLVVEGRPEDLDVLRGLQDIVIETETPISLSDLEIGTQSFVEVVISPYSKVANRTLRELHFREKYGLSVLAIWRGDRAYRTDLGSMPLRYGDALLCYGSQERFAMLARETDYIVLESEVQAPPRRDRALPAVLILLGMIASIILNLLPISIAALLAVVLMVLTRCVSMDEAVQSIEWKAVFLIAGMLPLGIAMSETGTAAFLADQMVLLIGGYGSLAVLAGIFLLTFFATQFMPNPVVAVLMAPIAITTAIGLGASPQAFVITVAYSASMSFLTPVSHPANVLVMSPGGYRFGDYFKNGLPLVFILLALTLLVIPLIFPF